MRTKSLFCLHNAEWLDQGLSTCFLHPLFWILPECRYHVWRLPCPLHKKRLELGKIHQCGRRGPHSGNRHEFHFYAVYVQPGCRSFGTGKIVGMWMCIYNSLDWPFSRLPVIEVKTLGHGFFGTKGAMIMMPSRPSIIVMFGKPPP